MKLFNKILIANRGEIACRIIRTCKKLGIATVAIYSDVDASALHVREADEAVALGDAEPGQSYLNIEKIIMAARHTQSEAIHPGYGFLAENAAFARSCNEAGLVFIGPPPGAIAAMGDKLEAKRLMMERGIATLAAHLDPLVPPAATRLATDLGFPVLLKAAAGGGGKGMRIVRRVGELAEKLASAQREAASAFGDERIFMEKFLERPRHIEVQILADQKGATLHLFERDCTVQRRHQKIIEESPSPVLSFVQRDEICRMAIQAARAMNYHNAGTVEFLYQEGQFYFLEMNTRLQVEHPITEWIAGTDIVRDQLLIAAGQALPVFNRPSQPRGHAIELRIYAEDPASGFLPSSGAIKVLVEPSGPGIRVDSSLYEGWQVPVEYDPLLAKLIVWAETRPQAIRKAMRALRDYRIDGIQTNIAFLQDVLSHPDFAHNWIDTYWVERTFEQWQPSTMKSDPGDMYTPWIPQEETAAQERRRAFLREHPTASEESSTGRIAMKAPMPGRLIRVDVQDGQDVQKGSQLMIVEAMKMEHSLNAPRNATVIKVHKQQGEQVTMGEILIELE